MITQPPHDEVGRYEVQCSVGQKRDESAGPCTPDCDRRPAGAIDEAGVDGVKHGAAPARVNKVRVPQADPLPGPSSLVLLMQRIELIDPLELRSAGGGVDLEGH